MADTDSLTDERLRELDNAACDQLARNPDGLWVDMSAAEGHSIITELLSRRTSTGEAVAVKPLEWEEQADGLVGRGGGYQYKIRTPNMTPGWRAWVSAYGAAMSVGGTIVTMRALGRQDAVSICQADYEARIRSALVPASAVEAAGADIDEKSLLLTKRIEREFYRDHPGGNTQVRAKVQAIIADALALTAALRNTKP